MPHIGVERWMIPLDAGETLVNLFHLPGKLFLIEQTMPDHRVRQRQKLSLRERHIRVNRLGEIIFFRAAFDPGQSAGAGNDPIGGQNQRVAGEDIARRI